MGRIWVVIPTYNRRLHLAETLASVRAQTISPERIIIVDDGSTDGTGSMLAGLERRSTDVQAVYLKINRGVNTVRRIGTALVPSDAIVVELDDHDLLMPNALELIDKAMDDSEVWFVYGDCEVFPPNGISGDNHKKEPYQPGQFRRSQCMTSGVRAYRKLLYEAVGGWRTDEWPAGDYALALRCEAALGDSGLFWIPHTLCRIRRDGPGITPDHRMEQKARAKRYRALARKGQLDWFWNPRECRNCK